MQAGATTITKITILTTIGQNVPIRQFGKLWKRVFNGLCGIMMREVGGTYLRLAASGLAKKVASKSIQILNI